MYPVRMPLLVQKALPDAWWRMDASGKNLYLTFDDGPTPGVTDWVLNELERFDARATFFVLGKNVEAHGLLYDDIIRKGHSTGNHSYSHPDGWKVSKGQYLQNVAECKPWVNSRLFRPPYGHLTPAQYLKLKKEYTVVMWDVLSGDFDGKITAAQCLGQTLESCRPGSIIVMHDSLKAFDKLKVVLPAFLKAMTEEGYSFLPLPSA
ncbi:MAG: polysaccharide deacetylase family protein [Flavobacteriales bacterium]|nr:polysaccharide deacetylase family protein [Flavobacteriales bacterium]